MEHIHQTALPMALVDIHRRIAHHGEFESVSQFGEGSMVRLKLKSLDHLMWPFLAEQQADCVWVFYNVPFTEVRK